MKFSNFFPFAIFLTFKFLPNLPNLSNQIYTLLFYHLPKSQIFKNIYKKERNLPGFHRISRGNFFFPPSFFREDSFRFLRLLSIGVEALFLVTIGEDVEIRKIFKFLSFCNFFNFLKTFQIFQIVEFIHFSFIIFQSSKVSNFQKYTKKERNPLKLQNKFKFLFHSNSTFRNHANFFHFSYAFQPSPTNLSTPRSQNL